MPGTVAPVADEREGLLEYLAQQRYVLRLTAHGLTEDQARQAGPTGTLTIGGLIKHVAATERFWTEQITGRHTDSKDYVNGFILLPDESLASTLAGYEVVAAETSAAIAAEADLGRPVPVPKGAPWFPADLEAWSVRWVLLHLIQETARHAGHADLVREAIDGATAYPLMAAAEGWPATSWLTPWKPG